MRRSRVLLLVAGAGFATAATVGLLVLVPADFQGTGDRLVRAAMALAGVVLVTLGIVRVALPAVRRRADFRRAAATSLGVGLAVAVLADLFFGGLAGFDVGPRPDFFVEAIPVAALLGLASFVITLAAYGLVTRFVADNRGASFTAVILVMLAVTVGQVSLGLVDEGRRQLSAATDEGYRMSVDAWEQRSALGVSVEVVDVEAAKQPDGSHGVVALTLALTFAPTTDIALNPATEDLPWRVHASYVYLDHDPGTVVTMLTDIGAGTPGSLQAGGRAEVAIRLEAPHVGEDPAAPRRSIQPGPWNLAVDVVLDGAPVRIDVAFSVPDAAP